MQLDSVTNKSLASSDAGLPITFTICPPNLGLRRSEGALEAFWPGGLPGLQLEQAASLAPAGPWTSVDGPRIHADGDELVRIATDNPRQFFRLQGP